MGSLRLAPRTYRALTLAALVSLGVIVETGALVRLTDSGLGCRDWPRCSASKFIDVSSSHAAIEQINRMFTGVVVVAVVLAVAGSLLRRPRRRDLTWLSLSLVVGVLGQAVVGGVVVLTHLNPVSVQQHFLLSMVIVATALVLYRRAGIVDQQHWHRAVDRSTMAHIWWIVALGSVALVTGTVVTGTGPHSGQNGSKPVRRFGFAISSVARVHSIAVLATLGTVLWLVWRLRGHPDRLRLENPLSALLLAGLVQGSVGYVQYFSGVPVGLVAIHIAGATLVWLAIVNLALATRTVVESAHRAESGADGMELAHGFVDDLSHRTN